MWRSNTCSAKILLMIELRSSRSSAMGSQRVRKLIDKGYRAYTMLETSNSLQRELQRADLNTRCKLISRPPRPAFICHMGTCGFISRQSALIAWHNAFNDDVYSVTLCTRPSFRFLRAILKAGREGPGTRLCIYYEFCKLATIFYLWESGFLPGSVGGLQAPTNCILSRVIQV